MPRPSHLLGSSGTSVRVPQLAMLTPLDYGQQSLPQELYDTSACRLLQ